MTLHVNPVGALRGLQWVGHGLALMSKHLVGFSLLLLVGLMPALVLFIVPVIGPLLAFALGPLITLGFAIGARAALAGEPVRAALMLEPLLQGTDAKRRQRLLLLTLCYTLAVGAVLVMVFASGGEALEKIAAASRGQQAEVAAASSEVMQAHPGLRGIVLLGAALLMLIGALFWHAPMLVWWDGQSVAQSLFSSALACWRNKGALFVYSLAWLAGTALLVVLGELLSAMLGSRELGALAVQPVTLLFVAAYYISVYFSYADCFASSGMPPIRQSST
jgi:hypothetical protein